jgi:hypothetical protein
MKPEGRRRWTMSEDRAAAGRFNRSLMLAVPSRVFQLGRHICHRMMQADLGNSAGQSR